MQRLFSIAAAIAVTTTSLVAVPPAAHASGGYSLSPAYGAASAVVDTNVTVTGPGLDASATVAFSNCSSAGAPAPGPVSANADGSISFLVAAFADQATCSLDVTPSGGSAQSAGTFTWTATETAFFDIASPVPSLLPAGTASTIMLTGVVVNPGSGRGDVGGFTGARSAALQCGGTNVAATITPSTTGAQATLVTGSLSAIPPGTDCAVTVVLQTGNLAHISGKTPDDVYVDSSADVPAFTVSPSSGAENQVQGQWVTLNGTGLSEVTAASFAYCPASNPTAVYPVAGIKPSADGTSVSVQVPNVPASNCAVIATLPARTASPARPAGYTVASVPPSGGFQFLPPWQGTINLEIANPASSGIADDDLWVSILANPAGGGTVTATTTSAPTVNAFAGVNIDSLTSVAFSTLTTYDSSTHTATIALTPPLASGNVYLSTADLTGQPPDPTASNARYGFAEFTYDAGGLDVDLTIIDQIGVTMSSDLYSDPQGTTAIAGSHRDTGRLIDLVNAMSRTGVSMNAVTDTPKGVMRYAGPAPAIDTLPTPGNWTEEFLTKNKWVGLVGASKDPAAYPSVQNYVTSVTSPLTITDLLNDPTYQGTFAYNATLSGGVWTLTGTLQNGTALGPIIQIEQAGLYGPGTHGGTGYGLYGQNGPFAVNLPTGTIASPAYDGGHGWAADGGVPTQWQNTVKTIYRDFIAGFAYGYWGSAYGNGTDTGNNAVNFTRNPVTDAYQKAQPSYPVNGEYAWDVYDEVVRSLSNVNGTGSPKPSGAYGMPYSDTFVPADLSPNQQQGWAENWTLTVGDPALGAAPNAAVTPSTQFIRMRVGTQLKVVGDTRAGAALDSASRSDARRPPVGRMVQWRPSGFTGPVTYRITPQRRFARHHAHVGLHFHEATGLLKRTARNPHPRTRFTVVVRDRHGHRATATLHIRVLPRP